MRALFTLLLIVVFFNINILSQDKDPVKKSVQTIHPTELSKEFPGSLIEFEKIKYEDFVIHKENNIKFS